LPEARGLKLDKCLKTSPEADVFSGTFQGRDVVVKRATGEGAVERASAQSDELYTQHPQMKDGDFRVPEPILTRPDRGLVIMEKASGMRLDQAILKAPGQRDEILAQAGEWLAHYTRGRKVEDNFGGGYWIKVRRKALDEMTASADKTRITRLIEMMETERNRIGPLPITRARSHGDFVTLNLMIDGDTIWGVDIQNSHWLALAKDLARFLIYLEISIPSGKNDGPCGLSLDDVEALTAARGLIRPGELEVMLPYFAAVELSGRLISEAHDTRVMENARALADRMLERVQLAATG
jgi:tRNA A-37 threonylcarbamoyl transferase component Bud32